MGHEMNYSEVEELLKREEFSLFLSIIHETRSSIFMPRRGSFQFCLFMMECSLQNDKNLLNFPKDFPSNISSSVAFEVKLSWRFSRSSFVSVRNFVIEMVICRDRRVSCFSEILIKFVIWFTSQASANSLKKLKLLERGGNSSGFIQF